MSSIQSEEVPCPFCGSKILCNYIPSSFSTKRTSCRAGKGVKTSKTKEEWNIQSDCSNCGKTANEIKRAMKEGVPPDKEKLKQRYLEIQKLKEEMRKS